MAIVLSHVRPMPLEYCFTHACPNTAAFILVTESKVGYSLMCARCLENYESNYGFVDVNVEPYTRERAEEIDALVRETYGEH
jgi:hypothetical protein